MAEEKIKAGNKNLLTIVIVAVIVGALAFYGGMQYQRSQVRSQFGQFTRGNDQFGGQRRGAGFSANGARPVGGQILSNDDKTVTIKMMDGSTKIVILSDKTVINKATTGSKDDLKTNENVIVFGTQNADGSITAQNIAIGGGMFRGMRVPAPSGSQ